MGDSRHFVRPANQSCVLYIGIPAYNEATTIGVLLWRLRSVLAEVSREYEVVVYDDASTDQTAETLAPYSRVLPLTVIRGTQRLGYAGATDALVRHVARTTRYPRRDALLLLQGDFTDPPELVPEFLRRFEGGADLVIGERVSSGNAPKSVRRLWQASRWVLRPFVGISDVRDLTTSFRLVRIAVLRDLIKAAGDAPIVAGEAWSANADFLLRTAPHARRVETIPVTPTFAVRTRETRRTAWPDAIALAKWGWSRRGQRVAAKVIARAVEGADTDEAASPDVSDRSGSDRRDRTDKRARRELVEAADAERSARERSTSDAPARERTRERPPRERKPRERQPRERVAREEGAPAAGLIGNTSSEAESETTAVDGAAAPRPARKRRKRGARRDRTTLSKTGTDESEVRDDVEGAPVESSDSFDGHADSGETRDDEAPEGGETGNDSPARRKRSRRGRRRRGEARSASGSEPADGADTAESGEARQDGARGSFKGGSEGSEDDGGTNGDGGPVSESDEAARKRRRSRRGRRGGSRKRTNGSPGEGEPRDGASGAGGATDGGTYSRPLEGA